MQRKVLRKLSPKHSERLYARKTRERLSASVVRHLHVLIHGALEQAVRKRYVGQNVSKLVGGLPRIKRHEAKTLTKEQVLQLIAAAKGVNSKIWCRTFDTARCRIFLIAPVGNLPFVAQDR